MAHTVHGIGVRVLLAAVEVLGLPPVRLLESVGVSPTVLRDPDARFAPEVVYALWDEAERRLGDPHLALRVARSIPPGSYRVVEYLVASAETVGAGVERISAYFAWIDTSAALRVVPLAGAGRLVLDAPVAPRLVPLRAVEFTFATCLERLSAAAGCVVRAAHLEVAGPPPAAREPIDAYFGCPVTFDGHENALVLERATWELPLPSADASLALLLEAHAERLVREVATPASAVEAARGALAELGPNATPPSIARRLGISLRTLQRRLESEGTSLARLEDEARRTTAERLLRERRVSITEIAFLLGFADSSSFSRTFRRWTGQSPAAFRGNPG